MSDNNDRPAVDPEGLSDEPTVTPAEDVEAPKVPEADPVDGPKLAGPADGEEAPRVGESAGREEAPRVGGSAASAASTDAVASTDSTAAAPTPQLREIDESHAATLDDGTVVHWESWRLGDEVKNGDEVRIPVIAEGAEVAEYVRVGPEEAIATAQGAWDLDVVGEGRLVATLPDGRVFTAGGKDRSKLSRARRSTSIWAGTAPFSWCAKARRITSSRMSAAASSASSRAPIAASAPRRSSTTRMPAGPCQMRRRFSSAGSPAASSSTG
nr:hypothetical protein [Corynebacterium xerosis]